MGTRPLLVVVALLLVACTGAPMPATSAVHPPSAPPSEPSTARAAPVEYPDAIVRRMRRLANEPRPVDGSALPPRQLDVERFPTSLVPRDRIVSGGPPPDGIPAIDDPAFVGVRDVDWLDDAEAVLVLRLAGTVRVYPVQIMLWHEIVNDEVDGRPVAVTYCPLCNSAVAFDRRVGRRVLDFGTSGALYQSAMVMYDRQTETLWTHFDGRAVVGTMVGASLHRLPVSTVAWRDVRRAHPEARILSRDTGVDRPYGRNPYGAYDQRDAPLTGFFAGDPDTRAAAMRRVVGVGGDTAALAVVTAHLAEVGVVADVLDDRPLTVWHTRGTRSPLGDHDVTGGEDVGATGAFVAEHGGRVLTFARSGGRFVDDQTATTWNILGEAVDGPLAGQRLRAVPHVDTFWFAWATYRPDTRLID